MVTYYSSYFFTRKKNVNISFRFYGVEWTRSPNSFYSFRNNIHSNYNNMNGEIFTVMECHLLYAVSVTLETIQLNNCYTGDYALRTIRVRPRYVVSWSQLTTVDDIPFSNRIVTDCNIIRINILDHTTIIVLIRMYGKINVKLKSTKTRT
jgi:Flp pilus assembly secretin CpaC